MFDVEKASEALAVGRMTGGSRFNPLGVLEIVPAGKLRFDHNPDTLAELGVLTEAAATNALLNSLVMASQSLTVTAAQYALSFYGAGTIVLSGAFSETIVGNGQKLRQTTIFTPSAGLLNIAVTGDVRMGQLELGGRSTSYIPTTGASATRGADLISFPLPPGNHTLTYLFDDNSQLVLSSQSGTHAISGALSRRRIKGISARPQ